MKRLLIFGFAAIASIMVISAAGSSSGAEDTTTRPGSETVYAEIAAETSCSNLQAAFDRAEANGKAARARGNLALAKVTTSYMVAADTRMQAIGCHE